MPCSGERGPLRLALGVERARGLERLGVQRHHRVQRRPLPIVGLDARQAQLHQLFRRQRAAVEGAVDVGDRQRVEVDGSSRRRAGASVATTRAAAIAGIQRYRFMCSSVAEFRARICRRFCRAQRSAGSTRLNAVGGHDVQGSGSRRAHAAAGQGLDGGRRAVAGARHRRQHGAVQRGQRPVPEEAAGPRSRLAGAAASGPARTTW